MTTPIGDSLATAGGALNFASAGAAPPSADPATQLAELARTGSPVEQGQALAQLDAATGNRAATDALVAGGGAAAVAAGAAGTAAGAGALPAGEQKSAEQAPEVCRVEVRYTSIGATLGIANHAFVTTTDADSTNFYRGGPESRTGGSNSGSSNSGSSGSGSSGSSNGNPNAGVFGNIATDYGPYVRGTVDWTETPSGQHTVAERPGNCDAIDASMARTADRIEAAGTPYRVLGPNSNSVARELLDQAGIPGIQPIVTAPGWSSDVPLGR